jgi:hypothetical protein
MRMEWYDGQSVSRPQMDIKRKTCDIRTRKRTFFLSYSPPTLIYLSHRFTSASKPAAEKSFDFYRSNLRAWVGHRLRLSNVLEGFSRSSCELLYPIKIRTVYRKYSLRISFCPQRKTRNRTLLFGSTFLKHDHHFEYETSQWTCACTSAT